MQVPYLPVIHSHLHRSSDLIFTPLIVTLSVMYSDTDNMKGLQLPPVKPRLPKGSTVPVPVMFAAMREYIRRSKIVIYSYTDISIVKKTK